MQYILITFLKEMQFQIHLFQICYCHPELEQSNVKLLMLQIPRLLCYFLRIFLLILLGSTLPMLPRSIVKEMDNSVCTDLLNLLKVSLRIKKARDWLPKKPLPEITSLALSLVANQFSHTLARTLEQLLIY